MQEMQSNFYILNLKVKYLGLLVDRVDHKPNIIHIINKAMHFGIFLLFWFTFNT